MVFLSFENKTNTANNKKIIKDSPIDSIAEKILIVFPPVLLFTERRRYNKIFSSEIFSKDSETKCNKTK